MARNGSNLETLEWGWKMCEELEENPSYVPSQRDNWIGGENQPIAGGFQRQFRSLKPANEKNLLTRKNRAKGEGCTEIRDQHVDLCARKLVGKLEMFIPKHKVRGYKQKPMQPTNKAQDIRRKIPSRNRRVYYNASQRQGNSQGTVECPKMTGAISKSVCKVRFRDVTPFYMVVHNWKIPDRPKLQV
ncbi:hypothetical protein C8R44DRAFT_738965 [Mycena epipterygia]|nr:hypothetical protein C8R44DRAFT_738965 [Mycena epipterygia]